MVRRRSARKPRALGLASTCCTHRPGAAHAPQCPCALAASWLLAVCPDAPNPPRVPLYYTHTQKAPISNQLAANQSHALAPRAFAPCPPTPPIHPQPTAAGRRDRSGQHQGNGTGGRRRCRVPPLAPITPRPILESARRPAARRADTPIRMHARTQARTRHAHKQAYTRTYQHTRKEGGGEVEWVVAVPERTHARSTHAGRRGLRGRTVRGDVTCPTGPGC